MKTIISLIIIFTVSSNGHLINPNESNSELDLFWQEASRTVKEGDFEGYKATFHKEAVFVSTTGENKMSSPTSVQLARWKPGFDDTKAGKMNAAVDFRFSQIINDKTTAHETGMFYYRTKDDNGNVLSRYYIHFEALLVKTKGKWQVMMEYQKNVGSEEEWEELK